VAYAAFRRAALGEVIGSLSPDSGLGLAGLGAGPRLLAIARALGSVTIRFACRGGTNASATLDSHALLGPLEPADALPLGALTALGIVAVALGLRRSAGAIAAFLVPLLLVLNPWFIDVGDRDLLLPALGLALGAALAVEALLARAPGAATLAAVAITGALAFAAGRAADDAPSICTAERRPCPVEVRGEIAGSPRDAGNRRGAVIAVGRADAPRREVPGTDDAIDEERAALASSRGDTR
jgi:hypothetical protein